MYYFKFFFRNKITFNVMKGINYKKSYLNIVVFHEKETLETCNYPEYFLHLQKERQIWQKSN